jgi:hypothetical protein
MNAGNATMTQLREGLRLLEDAGGSAYFMGHGLRVETVNTPPEYDIERLHSLGWRGVGTTWTYGA